jgi:VanZ family protein
VSHDYRTARAEAPQLRLATLWWLGGWALILFILYSTLAPSADVPNLHIWDKLEHAGAFFGLTMWFGGLIRRRRYPLLALWMLLLGAGIELAQGYMGWGRDMDARDFLADSLGVGVALVLLCVGLGQWAVFAERVLGLSREPS